MITKLTLLAVLASISLQAQTKRAPVVPWTKEPDSFRDAKFGASEADVRAKFEFLTCEGDSKRSCPFEFLLADAATIDGGLGFYKESFVEASGIFEPNEFPAVRAVFIERYGAPTVASDDLLTWRGKLVSIELIRSVTEDFKPTINLAFEAKFRPSGDRALSRHVEAGRMAQNYWMQMRTIALGVYTNSDMGEERKHDYEREVDRLDHEYELAETTENRRYEKEFSDTSVRTKEFLSSPHSGFSIAVNEYAAEVAKQKSETLKKGAGAL